MVESVLVLIRKVFTVGKPDSVPLKGCIHLSHDACAKFRHTPCPCGCDEPEVFGRATRLPISSCTGLGLSCREHCCSCGELLPRRFTLTRSRGRFVFCDTCRPGFDARPSLARGILLCGVRTFRSVLRSECIDREQHQYGQGRGDWQGDIVFERQIVGKNTVLLVFLLKPTACCG